MVAVRLEQLQLLEGQDMALVSREDLLAESIWRTQVGTDRLLVEVDGNVPLEAGMALGFQGCKPGRHEPGGVLGIRTAAALAEIRGGEQAPPAQVHLMALQVNRGHHFGARVAQKHRTNQQSQRSLTSAGRALHRGRLGARMGSGASGVHGEWGGLLSVVCGWRVLCTYGPTGGQARLHCNGIEKARIQ